MKAREDARKLLEKYNERQQEHLYQSVMDVIVKANIELFEEVDDMCDALMEIVKPKVEAKVKEATEKALKEGRIREKIDLISKKLAKGMSVEEIAELLEEPVEMVQKLINMM